MNYMDFVERVKQGEELNFFHGDFEYWISNNEQGYYLTKYKTKKYENADELFNNAKIEGVTLKELWVEIQPQLKEYTTFDELKSKVMQGEQPYFDYGEICYQINNDNLQNFIKLTCDIYKNEPPSEAFYLVASTSQKFKTAKDLLQNGKIENALISDLWNALQHEIQ